MTVILTFDDQDGGQTKYTARVRHWREGEREAHEKKGFHSGGAMCADQLAEVTQKL